MIRTQGLYRMSGRVVLLGRQACFSVPARGRLVPLRPPLLSSTLAFLKPPLLASALVKSSPETLSSASYCRAHWLGLYPPRGLSGSCRVSETAMGKETAHRTGQCVRQQLPLPAETGSSEPLTESLQNTKQVKVKTSV